MDRAAEREAVMSAHPAVVPVTAPAGSHLFVSTALDTWTTDEPERFARDFQINDTCYRRIDPEYYAWLRSRMLLAKSAASASQISLDAFDNLRHRFNAVHAWAVNRFGEPALIAAVRGLDVRQYIPPVPEPERPRHAVAPACPDRNAVVVSPDCVALVDGIRERALALGWTNDSLYRTGGSLRFPLGSEYGLICYLKPGDRIGEVTTHSIEIILRNNVRQRFYNPNVDQPWITRVGAEKSEAGCVQIRER
jgi:hypothetical protein